MPCEDYLCGVVDLLGVAGLVTPREDYLSGVIDLSVTLKWCDFRAV